MSLLSRSRAWALLRASWNTILRRPLPRTATPPGTPARPSETRITKSSKQRRRLSPRLPRTTRPATAQGYIKLLEYVLSDSERLQEARAVVSAIDAPLRKRTNAKEDLRKCLRRLNAHIGDILKAIAHEEESTGQTMIPDDVCSSLQQSQAAVANLQQLVVGQRDVDLHLRYVREHIVQAEARQARRPQHRTRSLIEGFKSREQRLQEQQTNAEARWRDLDNSASRADRFMRDLINFEATNTTSIGKETYGPQPPKPSAKPVDINSSQLEDIKQDWNEAKKDLAISSILYDAYINEREHGLRTKRWKESYATRQRRKADHVEFNETWFRESYEKYADLQDAERAFVEVREKAMACGLPPRTIVYMSPEQEAVGRAPVGIDQDLGQYREHAEDGTVESFSPSALQIEAQIARFDRRIIDTWWRSVFWSPIDAVSMPPSHSGSDIVAYPAWDVPSVGMGDSRSINDNSYGDGYNAGKRQKINEYKASCEGLRTRFSLVDGQTRYVPG